MRRSVEQRDHGQTILIAIDHLHVIHRAPGRMIIVDGFDIFLNSCASLTICASAVVGMSRITTEFLFLTKPKVLKIVSIILFRFSYEKKL